MNPERSLEELEDLDAFMSELREQIALLDRSLSSLRQEMPGKSGKPIETMRIAAHTIKGSARTFGFNPISKLGQILEQTFMQIQAGNLSPSHPLLEEFIKKGLDSLRILSNDLSNNQKESIDVDACIAQMKHIITQQDSSKESYEQFKEKKLGKILEEATVRGLKVYEVIVSYRSSADIPSALLLLFKKKLETAGKVAFSSSVQEGSQEGRISLIYLTHEVVSFIKTQADAVSQIGSCQCSLLNPEGGEKVLPIALTQISSSKDTLIASQNTLIIDIQLKENAFASSVRVLQIFRLLKKMGEIINSVPKEEELGKQKKVTQAQIWLKTNKLPEDVKRSLMESVLDIESMKVQEEVKKEQPDIKQASHEIDEALLKKLLRIAKQLKDTAGKLHGLKDEALGFGDSSFYANLSSSASDIEGLTKEFRSEVRGVVLGEILQTIEPLPELCLEICDDLRKEISVSLTNDSDIGGLVLEKLANFFEQLEQLHNELGSI